MNFKELCKQLDLEKEEVDEKQLIVLKKWCNKNVSTDLTYSGSLKEQYGKYYNLAEYFLDEFLTHIPQDLSVGVPLFKNMSTIQYAASQGWDSYLSSLKFNEELFNQTNLAGMTPLHIAVVEGNKNTTSVLLSLGAKADKTNKYKQLPLHSVLFVPVLYEDDLPNKKEQTFRVLWKSASQTITEVDDSGDTVIHQMASQGFSKLMIDVLKENPSLVSVQNNHSCFPIHTAILNNQEKSVQILLACKEVSKQKDIKGRGPLHYAARYSGSLLVELCCDAASTCDIRDENQDTPLMLAVKAGNLDGVKVLIEKGANVDLQDNMGQTLIHLAVASNNLQMLAYLLKNTKIDVNLKENNGQTALDLCNEINRMKELQVLLIEYGANDLANLNKN